MSNGLPDVLQPLVYCASYPPCGPLKLELPFGLPMIQMENPCCGSLEGFTKDLSGLLAPLMPLLKIIGCVVKLADIVMGIPDCIGPPPSPSKIADVVEKIGEFITECVPDLIAMAPLPINIIPIARFVRDLLYLVIAVLECLRSHIIVQISLSADILALSNSTDPHLRRMLECLVGQRDSLNSGLADKINGILDVFNLINVLLGIVLIAIPPLKNFMEEEGLYPIVPNMTPSSPDSPFDTEALDTLITVLATIAGVANIAAGGS